MWISLGKAGGLVTVMASREIFRETTSKLTIELLSHIYRRHEENLQWLTGSLNFLTECCSLPLTQLDSRHSNDFRSSLAYLNSILNFVFRGFHSGCI